MIRLWPSWLSPQLRAKEKRFVVKRVENVVPSNNCRVICGSLPSRRCPAPHQKEIPCSAIVKTFDSTFPSSESTIHSNAINVSRDCQWATEWLGEDAWTRTPRRVLIHFLQRKANRDRKERRIITCAGYTVMSGILSPNWKTGWWRNSGTSAVVRWYIGEWDVPIGFKTKLWGRSNWDKFLGSQALWLFP